MPVPPAPSSAPRHHAPASGAQLTPVLAELNGAAERIWLASAATCPGLSIEVLPELGSTNTELMARGRRGDVQPTLLAAARQTAGRGRLGRTWQAEAGDTLTFSLGLPLDLSHIPGGASALSLAVGLAVADALDAGLGAPWPLGPVGLKWPNDLWLAGRKLGGILIEASPAPGLPNGQRWVVIGVGLNVRPGTAPANSVSLADIDPASQPRLGEVWAWIAPALLSGVQAFARHGFAPLQDAYAQRDVLRDQSVGLWSTPGHAPADGHPPTQTGVAHGVDAQGALLVHTQQGVQAWHSGDISVRPHTA
ncbi:MAG: Biotin--[biotin carboxyl-carrier protein] ligase [Pseudomonadota bacterium]|nr:Biotin--[biotin carboxyl-carrier protein] ligase [Pseudomonadota bacterium]